MAVRMDQISAGDEPTRPFDRATRVRVPGLALLVGIAALSGFVFFALEVVWTHLVGTVLGNSVYAFAAMLAAVLVGLGLGGALTTLRFPKEAHIPTAELGNLFLVGAALVAITSSQWPAVPDTLARLGAGINSFGQAETLRWITALVLIVPPSAALGMVYPTLFRLPVFPRIDPAVTAGRLVAANSVGCIAGALAAGFGLIPTLGSESTLRVMTLLAVLLAALFCARFLTGPARSKRLLLAAAIAIAVEVVPRWDRLRLTNGKQIYFVQGEVRPETRLVSFHEDTLGGFTTVVVNPVRSDGGRTSYRRTLLTNGKFQGNDAHEMEAQTGFALVPAMFAPRRERALNIGLGTGRTAHVLRAVGFPLVDIAEIAPGIVAAAARDFRHINGSVLQDPGTRLFLEDGRNVLLLHDAVYDLITIEISSIWFAGSTNLFSREFYASAAGHLSSEGVFQQWIQIHHITLGELGTAITTLRSVFPFVSFWVVGGQGILVATRHPQTITARFLEMIEDDPARVGWTRDELDERLRTLVSARLLSPDDVTRLVASGRYPLNTDGNRRLEYETPRYNHVHVNFGKRNLRALKELASFRAPEVAPEASGRLAEVCRRIAREQYLKTLGPETPPRRPSS
jgi:spermidine synthase